MGKKAKARNKKAPLASFESLMSIESLVEVDRAAMAGVQETNVDTDNTVTSGQPWDNPDFYNLPTRQRNAEIFKVEAASIPLCSRGRDLLLARCWPRWCPA